MTVSTLVTTVGGSTSNSYATLAYANQHLTDRGNTSDWTAGTSDDVKSRCLLQAAIDIDLLKFSGEKYDPSLDDDGMPVQALQFPRNWTTANNGTYIPRRVMQAQCEQALYLFRLNASAIEAEDNNRIESFSRGGVSVTYADSDNEADPVYQQLAKRSVLLLKEFLLANKGGITLQR